MTKRDKIQAIRRRHELKAYTPDYMVNELKAKRKRYADAGLFKRLPHTTMDTLRIINKDIEELTPWCEEDK